MHINDLYTAEELKTSPTYNELLRRAGMQDGLNVRLPGLDGSHIGWGLNDPVDSEGWGASRITRVQRLLPHIQQFVRVRQALVRAGARSTTVTALLDNPRIGVLELDRRGRILEGNDRARSLLRHGDGLLDRNGMLRARAPADQGGPESQLLDVVDARREAEEFMAQFPIIYPDDAVLRAALRGAAAYNLSCFDAHIWAYAEVHGIAELLSEDFQHGRMYGTVTIRNPFLPLVTSA